IVSHPISETAAMKGLFDFSIVDSENPSGITLGTGRSSLLSQLRQEYDFEPIHQITQDNIIRLKVHHRNNGLRSYLGELHAEPTLNSGKLGFNTTKVGVQPRQNGKLQEFARIFSHAPLLQAWYDSGHSITGGACYEISYKNAPFNGMYWGDFSNFDLTKEKPIAPATGAFLSNIGTSGEDSLFSWVYLAICRGSKAKRLSHIRMKSSNDWLLCDDGSGEISDFLHATTIDNHHHLTLIHVKAANSAQPTRLISVSAHDVVINQAIKNINHLNKANLLAALSNRIGTANTKPAWTVTNGVTTHANAIGFVNAVAKWSAARINVHVVIVQPHTLRKAFRNKASTKPHYQLCTLLNSAAHQVAGLGGTLTVIGART
ncbi:hypothetical protein ACFQ6N_40565, partial [Kitasatospora sp. NPDC056446]|uniref:hypothetical protein n=1 Tax=Kitasatospora sp. NPDC056446 TaxID=3345819 RepID=UPI0036AF531F